MLGFKTLPSNLDTALELTQESELVAQTLGEQLFSYFLDNKHDEWRQYRAQITDFELRTGLAKY